jgi:hypothetical protein
MEKAQQRGKAKKTHGGKILQNTPKKSIKSGRVYIAQNYDYSAAIVEKR